MSKIKVLIADDHSIIQIGLSDLLTDEGSFEVVATAGNGEEAVALTLAKDPDIVIMDLLMPQKGGILATAEIMARRPETRILVLTSFGSSDDISRALAAGAAGAILKDASNEDLIDSIKRVAAGEKVVPENIRRMIAEDPPLPELSQRQMEILSSITRGLTNTDIAKQLGIGVTSVKTHMEALFLKIGAANRAEAVAIALRKHLLKI